MRADLLPDAKCSHLSRFIAEAMGLHFPRARWADLRRGLAGAMNEFGFDDMAACVAWLLSGPPTRAQLQVLASHLTIGETYFFRDQQVMEALATRILPELIEARRGGTRRLRIWSAACCTGEEPYSLAILLHQILPDLRDWDVTITATDINARFLRRASAGIYGEWSFRDAPPGFRERYFTPTPDGRHAILPELRELVRFSYLNLAGDGYPSPATGTQGMDLIFCRNVLMYFTPAQIEKVIGHLDHALVEGGWLAVSPSEACDALAPGFVPHNFPGGILYQKCSAEHRAERALARPSGLIHDASVTAPSPVEAAWCDTSAAAPVSQSVPAPQPEPAVRTACTHPPAYDAEAQARSLANLGRLDEALACCERWIAIDKLNPAPRYLHAVIHLERGDAEQARRSLQRAIYLQPDLVLAHYALGNLAREGRREDESRRHFTNALEVLKRCDPDELVSESEGLTAAKLAETIASVCDTGARHGQ